MFESEEFGIEGDYMIIKCNANGCTYVLREKLPNSTTKNTSQVEMLTTIKEGLNASFANQKRFYNENIQRSTA